MLALAFIAVLFVSVYFLISMDGNKKGTAEEVISYSMEIEADIKAILPVENESASLCVFQNKKDLDYLYVAYLESYENGLYSYGIAYDFLAGEDGVYRNGEWGNCRTGWYLSNWKRELWQGKGEFAEVMRGGVVRRAVEEKRELLK